MDTSKHKEWVKREFITTLKYLASEPEVVIEAHGPTCVTCDLFEDYKTNSDAFIATHGNEIDHIQTEQIKSMASFLDDMPNDDFVCFYNSMLSRPNWKQVRQLARDVLSSFNESWNEIPKFIETAHGIWEREK